MKRWILLLALPLAAQAAALPDTRSLPLVPRYELSAGTVQKALQSVQDKRGQPMRFAVGVPTDLRLTEGRWDDMDTDTAHWRLRLHSPGALSLNLQLADVQLPPSARLWLYDINARTVQGPYTQKDIGPSGHLWTALTTGEETVLEVQAAKLERDKVGLRVVEVNHGFKDIVGVNAKSGSCNIDTACPEGDAWRNEIRSVARITIGGKCYCTGQLVNNARQDLTPYFLTADHCGLSNRGECASPAESLVAYWNYQTSQCGGTPDGNLSQNQSGATLVASDAHSDFTLLRLSQTPPITYNVYYAGWNNGASAPQSGVSLHHPSGEEKRISVYATPATATDVTVNGTLISSWQVQWAKGVTEPGSSGGGLWDQNHYLVGVLSGGDSSCSNPGGSDYFGRLNVGWTANPQPSGQLKANLDPDNSGRATLAGRDPSAPAPPGVGAPSGSGVVLGSGAFGLDELLLLWALTTFHSVRINRARKLKGA